MRSYKIHKWNAIVFIFRSMMAIASVTVVISCHCGPSLFIDVFERLCVKHYL